MATKRKPLLDTPRLIVLGVVMGCVASSAFAGEWKIVPSVSVNETLTDNVALTSTQKKSDQITDINPGIHIEGAGGRSKLRFDYQLHNLIHAQDSSRNQTQNSLNALGTLEALENWFFIEASGVISQQSISAFGGATATDVNTNTGSNSTETSTYRLSPYFRGVLGSFADYQLRYNLSSTSTKTGQSYDSDTREVVATLKGVTGLTDLRWSLDASSMVVDYSNIRSNEADRLNAVLTYQFAPQFRVLLLGGRESNNYQSVDKQSNTTRGAGFEWSPTERTLLAVRQEDRFFGPSRSVNFSHRTARTAWKYSESKDATVLSAQQQSTDLSGLFLGICPSLTPPNLGLSLSDCVRALQSSPLLQGGFLSSGTTLQHRRELSFALLGVRNTVTFAATQSESQGLSQGAGTGLLVGSAFSNAQKIRQRGASINWSHKLTPLSTLSGTFSSFGSTGTGGSANIETNQKIMSVNFLTPLGPKTNASLGVRRVVVDGATDYTENALTGLLSHRF